MGNRLEVKADTDVWAVLLSKELGLDTGVDDTVAVALKRFGVRRRDRKQVGAYLTAVLERVVAGGDSDLPFRAVRWQRLDELPVILFFGSLAREVGAEAFLVEEGRDDLVAPVVVENVDAVPGTTVRRSLARSQQEQGVLTGLRYVVDTGDPQRSAWCTASTLTSESPRRWPTPTRSRGPCTSSPADTASLSTAQPVVSCETTSTCRSRN